jgi:predicted dehydrogenase
LLWEAFVFPWNPQTDLLLGLLADGAVGELRAVQAEFHFPLDDVKDIRFDPALAGGALNDVGCYPVALARLLFEAEPEQARATRVLAPSGVDTHCSGVLTFPGRRQLLFSCGFDRAHSAYARIVGTDGELRVSNAYHPTAGDVVEHWRDGRLVARHSGPPLPSFAYALRHVHDVLRGRAAPRHLALQDALGNARALELVRGAAR